MSLPKKRKKLESSSYEIISPGQQAKPSTKDQISEKPVAERTAEPIESSSQPRKKTVQKKSKKKSSATPAKIAATETQLNQSFKLADHLAQVPFVSEESRDALDLPAASVSEKTREKQTPAEQTEQSLRASLIIQNHVMLAIGAGLVPAPFLDLVLASAVQVKLVGKLAQLYEKDFSPTRAKYLITALAGNYAVGVSSLWGAASLAKVFPVIGSFLGTATIPAAEGAFTYAIGRVFSHYFELGGTLSDFDSSQNKEYFEKQLQEGQQMVHIQGS